MYDIQKKLDIADAIVSAANEYAYSLDDFMSEWDSLSDPNMFFGVSEDGLVDEWLIVLDEAAEFEKQAIEDSLYLEKLINKLAE